MLAARLIVLLSLDNLIRPLEHADRNCQTDLFRSLKVNDEFKLRCLLHRQISWIRSFKDPIYVLGGALVQISGVNPIGHEAALIDKFLLWVNSGQPVFSGKLDDPLSFGEEKGDCPSSLSR